MFNEIFASLFSNFIPNVSWLMSITVSVMLGGIIVNIDEGYGKIVGSNLFQSRNRLFLFFILEIVIIAFFEPIIQTYLIRPILVSFTEYMISIFILFYLFVFIWFMHSYDFNVPLKPVFISLAIATLWIFFMYI
jgi:hypothetical protein